MDSFDKGWFVLQTYSGYENKVKENLLQRAQTYNMLDNILRVEIPTQTVQVEKLIGRNVSRQYIAAFGFEHCREDNAVEYDVGDSGSRYPSIG